jgi:O-methyltransferase involved in polyketide biosynthesis
MVTPSVGDFDKISPTALMTAQARQFSDIPYTREIAALSHAEAVVQQMLGQDQDNPLVRGLAVLVEARYRAIEQVRANFSAPQILELASGLLPRGMIVSQDSEITFIESDLPEMIQQKHQLAQQLIGDRSNLHFLAINATDSLDFQNLQDYFQSNQPVTILCEGLLMYLTFTEKEQVFTNVREILQTYGGVWITSDLTTRLTSEQTGRNDSSFQSVNQKFTSLTGRSFAKNEFDDLDHVRQFVQTNGFQLEEFRLMDVFDQLTSISVLGIDVDRIKAMLAALPVFALTPA